MPMPVSVVFSHNADPCRICKLNKQPDTRDKDQKGSQQQGPNNNRGELRGQQQCILAPISSAEVLSTVFDNATSDVYGTTRAAV